MKACSEVRHELTEWAREQIGCEPKFCDVCDPASENLLTATATGQHAADHHLTKLENEIVSAVVESAVIHLDNDLEYRLTIGDVAQYLSKTTGQISAAMRRLVAAQVLEIEPCPAGTNSLPATFRVFPTAVALGTVPAFANMTVAKLQRELAMLRDFAS